MNRKIGTTLATALILLVGSACGEGAAPGQPPEAQELALGARGPEVQKVYDFLRRYGYFENPELRARFRHWQPVIHQTPPDTTIFDAVLAQAVRAYQRLNGLPQTGRVDAATAEVMSLRRCGHPDSDPQQIDPSRKFALWTERWPITSLRYRFDTYTADIPDIRLIHNAVRRAVGTWAAAAPMLTFARVSSGESAHIKINMTSNLDGPGGTLAQANFPLMGNQLIWFDESETWSTTGGTGTVDVETVALHEFGHALGLRHSLSPKSVMAPSLLNGRFLQPDDKAAINALYPRFDVVDSPGARDLGAGGGKVWAISNTPAPGGFRIMEFSNGSWTFVDGGAVRIAVQLTGDPVVVNSAGDIFRRRSGAWEHLPGLRATDIAADGKGTVWAIGRDRVSDAGYRIYSLGSSNAWVEFGGLAVRIGAGGTSGFFGDQAGPEVWVINGYNQIFRKVGAGWQFIPGAAIDVAVGPSALGNEGSIPDGPVYVLGTDGKPYIWVRQDEIVKKGATDTPAVAEWRQLIPFSNAFIAWNIAVAADYVWVTESPFTVRRARR